ncbi:hypothetical protein MFIFM68171_02454 [Madurella fahalii]|uniref:RDRP core domain-containing protein n=1 Tax=Madurella fahalii TaxID=1157608 RepID=A0ABQ0G3B6_9PEZI
MTWEPRQKPRNGTGDGAVQQPRPPTEPQPPAVIPPSWSSQKSVLLIIRGVPVHATPWDIRQFFDKYGSVVYVELDDYSRAGTRAVKVRFEPPPRDISFFQNGYCNLVVGGTAFRVGIEFPRQSSGESTLTTPLGNPCPALLVFTPAKLTFGILTQPTTFMPKRKVRSFGSWLGLKFTADFKRKRLVIHFPLRVGYEQQYHRIEIKFGNIKNIHRLSNDGGSSTVLIAVHDPPLAWEREMDMNGEGWAERLLWTEEELWHRSVEIRASAENPRAEPVSLDEGHHIIDFGQWTTYWIDLDKPGEEVWSAIEMQLRDWNIKTKLDANFTKIPDRNPDLWAMLAESPGCLPAGASSSSWSEELALLNRAAHISLPFDVRYQLEVCISRGILCQYNIEREFLQKLIELSKPGCLDSSRARLILEYAADQGQKIYDPMALFENQAALTYYPTTLHIPEYCALVRKVTVTPTNIYFNTPTVEATNRVVRRYNQVQELFLRVQFTDELLEGRIKAGEADRHDELFTRIYRIMLHGIRMGKWHWRFLAFGNSQIREHGAFFFCQPDEGDENAVTCDSICRWMGNFNHISVVAKLAARLGQCFSSTRLLNCISSPKIVKIPDVEKGEYCFTDGVGKISPMLSQLVSDAWGLHSAPSAFQFRMGGCKGVLVTWPEAKGTEVHIRRSQEKFHAEYNGLEIIRCSQFACATLNRQTITVLSCLGIPDDVFTDMMKEQLASYDAAMADKNKAIELLNCYVDENMTTTTIARMVVNGFMDSKEPFVQTILQLWRSWSIKGLKEKARLIVNSGAFVLGGVDETGTLRGHSKTTEGYAEVPRERLPQIFLQIPDPRDRSTYKAITGICMVGRNPSLHPGDIRVVEAVDVPELRHIKNVVLFPRNGDRDVPSMCSGGDLDGDDFFVIWDPKLIPREWGNPPMNYSAPAPLSETTASVIKSLASFFVLFMKNDRLPLIAHAHLATADYEAEGVKHRKCLQLAELHSTAVDYVKTGVPAKWHSRLEPRKYPHFMEKSPARSYHSNSVLGKLYDMVDGKTFDCRENYRLPFDDRILKRYQLGNDMLKEARKIKSQYDIAIRRIMGQLEIRTEFEVWTAFVLSKPRIGTDYKVQEKVGRESAGLKKQFRDLCIKAAGDRDFATLGPFVAAMYRVTWEELRIALYETRQPHVRSDGKVGLRRITVRSMPLITFPWLFPDELGRIATSHERGDILVDLGFDTATVNPKHKASRGPAGLRSKNDLASMDCTQTKDGQFIHRGEILHLFHLAEDEDDGGPDSNDGVPVSDLSGGSELGLPSDSDRGPQTPDKTISSEDGSGNLGDLLRLDIAAVEEGNDDSLGSDIVSLRDIARSAQETSSPQSVRDDAPDEKNTFPVVPDLLTSSPVRIVQAAPETDRAIDAEYGTSPFLGPAKHRAQTLKQKAITDTSQPKPDKTRKPTPRDLAGASKPSVGSMASGADGSWERLIAMEPVSSGPPLDFISLPASERSSLQDVNLGSANSVACLIPTVWDIGAAARQAGGASCPEQSTAKDDEAGESGSEIEYEEDIVEVEAETAVERAARLGAA